MGQEIPQQLWTIDDVLDTQVLGDPQIAPDSNSIAFTSRRMWKEGTTTPSSSIWLVDTNSGETRQFTSGPRADLAPRWSPDSTTLAFLSDRDEDGRFGINLLARDGGEARSLLDLKGSVVDLAWSPDGQQIAFIMLDPETEDEKQRAQDGDDAIEFEAAPKYQRLWVARSDGSALRPVTPPDVQVWEFAWFPDNRRCALICSQVPFEWSWYQAYVATIGLDDDRVITVHQSSKQVALPVPSPDAERIGFITGTWSDRGVVAGEVLVVAADGGAAQSLTANYPADFSWLAWLNDDTLLSIAYEDGEGAVLRLSSDSAPRTLWSAPVALAERHWARGSLAADRATLAIIREDYAAPPDVWTITMRSDQPETRQHTNMQSHLAALAKGTSETLRWESLDGTSIQGILIKPAGYQAGQRYPLVTIVHGGPSGLYAHGFMGPYWTPLFAAHGIAVFLPNPRGSVGWGTAFAEANLGDMGGADFDDVMTGVNMLVERGIADQERLGIAGWSYGGFMTAWAVTQTERFCAALMGAGIANWRSFHGVSNLPTWDRLFYGSDPYELGSHFDRFSPILHVEKVRTPTLILHGEADAYVPVGQAYEFFRALKEHDQPVELVVYPREGHGIQERAHFRHMLKRSLEWFIHHLR